MKGRELKVNKNVKLIKSFFVKDKCETCSLVPKIILKKYAYCFQIITSMANFKHNYKKKFSCRFL